MHMCVCRCICTQVYSVKGVCGVVDLVEFTRLRKEGEEQKNRRTAMFVCVFTHHVCGSCVRVAALRVVVPRASYVDPVSSPHHGCQQEQEKRQHELVLPKGYWEGKIRFGCDGMA